MTYTQFLLNKQIEVVPSGFDIRVESLNSNLFDWQKAVTRWAIKKGKAALFEDCGLGKTLQQLEWANQVCKETSGNVLILTPFTVAPQTKGEGDKFGIDVNICRSQKDIKSGINITNYEMLDHFDTDSFTGVVLDESSILKSYMGKTKRNLVEKFKDTPYKLTCTATPAPNDHMEILNQAEFLGVMKSSEALAIWFINDTNNSGTYKLKGHAVKSFWEWVSTWAICMTNPSDIGFNGSNYILPKLNEHEHIIKINELDETYEDGLFRKIETNATAFHKEKRFTADQRAGKCAEIVNQSNEQYLIWCYTNYEADLLSKHIPEAIEVRGSDKPEHKERCAKYFTNGQIRVLISKPEIFGFGLNFQNCHNTIFCGLDYSYESYYQAIRRFWRYGQKNDVNAHIVIGSTERRILETIKRKEKQQQEMHENMYGGLKEIQEQSLRGTKFTLNLNRPKVTIPEWLRKEA